jgi:glutamyl-tRNA synthetase
LEEQKQKLGDEEKQISHREVRDTNELPELPDVNKTGVIMRFAPAPSGPMHLGHAITGMTSCLYVKKYRGKFYIRIEDTDPERVDPDSYANLKEGCDWLFGKFTKITEYIIQSDRLEIYYKYAEELIKKGFAYVCTCKSEDFKELIKEMKECACRKNTSEENLELWKKMLSKEKDSFKEGDAVLRFKSDIKNPNPAMRDFPLARINEHKHPRVKNKYKVWPLMNLSVAVDDIEYKMTHIIRAKEHRDNSERQKLIFKALGKEKQFPWTFFMGRYKFTDLVLSKRKIKAAIEAGEFEGWDDPRLPTIASLKKRGYTPKAFEKFATQRGLSEVDKVLSQKDFFQLLDRLNKEE